MDYLEYIENNTLRCDANRRGGGIEINLTDLFPYIDDAGMTAYQNYLGGGILGAIQTSLSFYPDELTREDNTKLVEISDQLKRYFHNLTNHSDEWENVSYERGQMRPASAY